MTVVVTIAVEDRYRGLLASLMLEVAAGVYVAPGMTAGVRQRLWGILADWHAQLGQGSIVMVAPDADAPGGTGLHILGDAPKEIVEHDGHYLVRRPVSAGVQGGGDEAGANDGDTAQNGAAEGDDPDASAG